MTENKLPLDNWIEDIVAFHKSKRKFDYDDDTKLK